MLQVLLIEELRVIETCTHDALVAVDDRIGDLGVCVRDDDELTRELSVLVVDREVALVREHGLADDLMRDLEELLVELADKHGRPLAEVDDLIERALRHVHVGASALFLDLADALEDGLATPLLAEDTGIFENLLVVCGRLHDVLARAEHAVSARLVAARDAGIGHRHDLVAQKCHDPADRAHERLMFRSPALAAVVWPLEAGNRVMAKR